jgi:hypothetical protein
MKTELEQAAEIILANNIDGLKDALKDDDLFYFYKGVIQCYGEAMANWQQEQQYNNMFSETDMTGYALYVLKNDKVISPKEWKETFKQD